MINIGFVVKIMKLVLIIANISYFFGFFWYIFCDLLREIQFNYLESDITHQEEISLDSFQEEFGLVTFKTVFTPMENTNLTLISETEVNLKTPKEKAIIVTYFAFTTLSTVGFGDYYPKSEVERLVGAFLLLFGVAIFSLFMGVFIEMIDKYKAVNAELEDGD